MLSDGRELDAVHHSKHLRTTQSLFGLDQGQIAVDGKP
jgi:hypothetical protein